MDVIRDLQMAGDRYGALDRATPSDTGASPDRDTGPRWRCGAPMCTLWPIWMRLSSFTPFSMTVSSRAPRSIVVFAPISTSSPIPHSAELGDLHPDPGVVGDAESIGADDDSGMDDGPCPDVHALAHHDPGPRCALADRIDEYGRGTIPDRGRSPPRRSHRLRSRNGPPIDASGATLAPRPITALAAMPGVVSGGGDSSVAARA